MPRDVPPTRTARIIKIAAEKKSTVKSGKVDIKPELKELFGQLVEAIIAAREAGRIASEQPSPGADRTLRDLDLQIDAIISRINQIIG